MEAIDPIKNRKYKTGRTILALILREMSTTYGKSPGGYIWAVLEPAAGVALLAVIFSLAFRAPPIGQSFSLFYATGLLPFLMFIDISRKIAGSLSFSKQLLFYPGVTFIDAIFARFILNFLTQLLVFLIVSNGIIKFQDISIVVDVPKLMMSLVMAGALGIGVGSMNCFLMKAFPIWVRFWGIMTRPLFLLSCIFVMFDHVPEPFRSILWYNPLVHIVGTMRDGFYTTYRADYVSPTFVFLVSLILFTGGVLFLYRWHRDIV